MKIQNSKFKIQILSLISLLVFTFLGVSPAYASTLSLSPSSGTFNKSCTFSLDILLDTQGVGTDGTDAYINFDSSRFTMTSIDTAGKVYPEYPGSGIDPQNSNRILVSGLAAAGRPYSGSGKLATINFAVKDSAQTGVTQMTFDFNINDKSDTRDSNVVQTGVSSETLSSVNNGSYTIGTGSCTSSTPTPTPSGANIGGPTVISTPSATAVPLKTIPTKEAELPTGGTSEFTAAIAIVGALLTVLGILGLAFL